MRVKTGVRFQMISFFRDPLNVALLVGVPAVVIIGFARAMASYPMVPMMETSPATVGRIVGALFSTAFITGLVGLFQILSAQRADQRLVNCGYSRLSLLTSRILTVAGVGVLVTAVSYVILSLRTVPEAPLLAFAFLALGGVIYGLLGILIGTFVPGRLEGSLVLVFAADIDGYLGSGITNSQVPLLKYLPLHYPQKLLKSAVIDGTYTSSHLFASLGYVAALLVIVIMLLSTTSDAEGVV